MRPIRYIGPVVVLAASVVFANCGSSNPASPSQGGNNQSSQGLAATWQATRAEFVSAANSNIRVEVVSRGTTIVLSLQSTGAYSRTITDPGHAPNVETGTWSASRDVLTLRPAGMPFSIEFDYTLSGNTLTLAGGHVEFDINGDGAVEEAVLNSTLART